MVASKLQPVGDCFGRLSPKALSRRYRRAFDRVQYDRRDRIPFGTFHMVDKAGDFVHPDKILDAQDCDIYYRPGPAPEPVERTVLEWERTEDGWETKCRSFVIAPNGKTGRFVLWSSAGLQIAKGSLKAMKERAQDTPPEALKEV